MLDSLILASRTLNAIKNWSVLAKYISVPEEQTEDSKNEEIEAGVSNCASGRIWWCCLVVLGILNLSWSIFLFTRVQFLPTQHPPPAFRAATKEVVFTESQHLNGPHSKEDDLAWKDLGPKSNHFTLAQGSQRYGFEPGDMISDSNYTVSMFHELHCLVMFRESYYSVVGGGVLPEKLRDADSHFVHCFNYVKQSILCRGDLTLEPRSAEPHPDGEATSIHRCADWERGIEWV